MQFVDRHNEQLRLEQSLNAENPTFTVLYGRRRLGKSTLLTKILKDDDIYYLADQSEAKLQRELLAQVISHTIPQFGTVIYPDWNSFFTMLNHQADRKFTLCLDEFPYLVQTSPELPSVLQRIIDSKTLKYNIIICGSSQQLMYGLALDATSPLYGRAHTIMRIDPIKVPYIAEALHMESDAISAIEEYSVWGGVPRYWELREHHSSLREAISYNVLSVNGTLYEEPIKLFKEDIKDIVKTATIMTYIGSGVHRLSEIASRCGEPSTNLSRPLSKLIELSYLKREIPFGENHKNVKKSLYKIADQFVCFYYRFVAPYRSFIELGRTHIIEAEIDRHFSHFVGEYWEQLCRDAITGNTIAGQTYGTAHRWWGSVSKEETIEIDVVAESIDKTHLLVGECKWTQGENEEQLLHQLKEKANKLPFAEKYTIVPYLFLKVSKGGEGVVLPEEVVRLIDN